MAPLAKRLVLGLTFLTLPALAQQHGHPMMARPDSAREMRPGPMMMQGGMMPMMEMMPMMHMMRGHEGMGQMGMMHMMQGMPIDHNMQCCPSRHGHGQHNPH
jgi:hypothetical protein